MMKLERANFKLIEAELFNYRKTQNDLESMMSRLPSTVIIEVSKRLEAIDYAIQALKANDTDVKWKLIEMKYFSTRYSDKDIMKTLYIGRTKFFETRKQFVRMIANRLGWRI